MKLEFFIILVCLAVFIYLLVIENIDHRQHIEHIRTAQYNRCFKELTARGHGVTNSEFICKTIVNISE